MKKIYLILLLIIVASSIHGQSITITHNNKDYEVTYQTIVEDSTGQPYSSDTWIGMVMNGEYRLIPKNPGKRNTAFFLEKLSPQEQAKNNAIPPEESTSFITGEKFSFRGTDIKGKKINSNNLEGKIVVINFWFINCPPCRREIPYLNNLVKEYEADSNIVFIAIALDGKKDLEKFLQKIPFNYNILVNGGSHDFRISQFPTHVILDQKARVSFHTVGYTGRTGYWIRKKINEIKQD